MQMLAAVPRHTVARLRALVATARVLGLLLSISFAGTAQAATTLNVGVGVGSGTVSGNAYLPGDVTILVGDSIKWTIESDEPHSVTFGTGPADTPPDEWPVTGLTGAVPPPPATANLTGSYAGSGFLNTGLLFKGSTATVAFTAAGSLPYICAAATVWPRMMLIAMAIGMRTMVRVSNWREIDSNRRVWAYSVAA